jgi:hypothetical protein
MGLANYKRKPDPLWDLIPEVELKRILSQDQCELDFDFLGFTDVYIALAQIIPLHFTVIDFGCYLAAQCYCFSEHKKYIGVDVVNMKRFSLKNTEHFTMPIQHFIETHKDDCPLDTTFAICSYVPDFNASELVRNTYKNVFSYYPAGGEHPIIKIK